LKTEILIPEAKRKKKSSRDRPHYRQQLSCPICHFTRLIDSGQNTRSETYVVGETGYLNADYYAKCPNSKCKADIGIRKIE